MILRTLFVALLLTAFAVQVVFADAPKLAATADQADYVLIEKGQRRLSLWRNGEKLKQFSIALGFAPAGDKSHEGDGRTPEGIYRVDRRNAASKFHLSLGIDYPRPDQRAAAKAEGRNPGGDIFIHGQPNGYQVKRIPGDWTAGCAAVTNSEMREIWSRVPMGTRVEIRP